ncbi:hypothetical protein OAK17_02925 [Alphaproteobacteria bacterium]|nr:hypothetical protein [Alphaproteobacteria bacterium]
MIAINLDLSEDVAIVYSYTLELGAIDYGKPGKRSSTFYGAYAKDLDNNKLCFYSRSI